MRKTSPNSNAYGCLKVEDITPLVKYSMTINPNDSYQEWDQPFRVKRFNECCQSIFKLFNIHDYNIEMYNEISKNGRLHYHGTIQFQTTEAIENFFIDIVHRLQKVCMYEIDTIENETTWLKYCTKSFLCKNYNYKSSEQEHKQDFISLLQNYDPLKKKRK